MTQESAMLAGRTAIVTGSTSGIGLGIAEALAARGASVMINGLGKREQIDAALERVRQVATAEVVYDAADMLVPAQIEAMVDRAAAELGAVDILVNNAGIQHVSPIESFPVEKWDAVIGINLSSAFHTIRCATPHLVARGRGRIINIASAHALVASPFKAAYVAAKHGIAGLTKTVALELATKGVTVNAVAPGYVKTPLVENQIADTARARGISEEEVVQNVMLTAQPTKQFVTIEQVAAMVIYLCSDDAASVNGTILSIDGGWLAQ